MKGLVVIVVLLTLMGSAITAEPVATTIESALLLANGSVVTIENAQVYKIWTFSEPHYFGISQAAHGESFTLIVMADPEDMPQLTVCRSVGVSGKLSANPEGGKMLVECKVWFYKDGAGRYTNPPPMPEGVNLDWPSEIVYDAQASVSASGARSTVSSQIRAMDDPPFPQSGGNPDPIPIYDCNTVAEIKAAYDANYVPVTNPLVMVHIECMATANPGSGTYNYFDMTDSTGSILTYHGSTSPVVQPFDRINRLTGTVIKSGSDYWIEVDAGPSWTQSYLPGSIQKVTSGTIAWAKTFPDGTVLPIENGRTCAIEGAVLAERMYDSPGAAEMYFVDPGGFTGIYVTAQEDSEPTSGGVFNFNGTVYSRVDPLTSTLLPDRQIATTESLVSVDDHPVKPYGLSVKNLYCGAFNKYSMGMPNGKGLNMSGALVKIWGKITYVGTDHLYLDDGSGMQDGTSNGTSANVGVRVLYTQRSGFVDVGQMATFIGFVGTTWDTTASLIVPVLRPSVNNWEPIIDGELVPPSNLSAEVGNGEVLLSWDPTPCRGYVVGRYSYYYDDFVVIGDTTETEFLDTTIDQGDWYDYYVICYGYQYQSAVGDPLFVQTDDVPSKIAIDAITASSSGNGYIAINYTLTPGDLNDPDNIDLYVDEIFVCSYPAAVPNGFVLYDTSELENGSHSFELRASPGFIENTSVYLRNSFDTAEYTVNNWTSSFKAPLMAPITGASISATFQGQTSWTMEFYQNNVLIDTITGSGSALYEDWDGGGATEGVVVLSLTTTDTQNNLRKQYRNIHVKQPANPVVRMWSLNSLVDSADQTAYNAMLDRLTAAYDGLRESSPYFASNLRAGAGPCFSFWTHYSQMVLFAEFIFDLFEFDIEIWHCGGYSAIGMPKKAEHLSRTGLLWGSTGTGAIYGFTAKPRDLILNGVEFKCVRCLLDISHTHPAPPPSNSWWNRIMSSLTATPTGSNSWDTIITPPGSGGPSMPTYRRHFEEFSPANNFRIVMLSGLGTGNTDFHKVFGIEHNYFRISDKKYPGEKVPNKNFKRKNLAGAGMYGAASADDYIDHVYIGFSAKSSEETLTYLCQRFWHYMDNHSGHARSVWYSAKIAFDETNAWAKKNGQAKPPVIWIWGDPYTHIQPNTNSMYNQL